MAEEVQTNEQQKQEGTQSNNQGATEIKVDIDYDKIAKLVLGKQNKTEDKVVAGVLQQEGLSGDELTQAVKLYKEHKAKNTPDVNQMSATIERLNKENRASKLENLATLSAIKLGADISIIPYLLKCVDFPDSEEISAEDVDKAVKKVFDDVPQFKSSKDEGNGFHSFGGKDSENGGNANEDEALKRAFGIK